MIQVLALIMVILLFLTSLFTTVRFRYKTALMRIQKEEAICAAEAALQLMESEIVNGNTDWMKSGEDKIITALEFETEDGKTTIRIPVTIWAEYELDEVHLFAEAEVGSKKEMAHSLLKLPENSSLMTDSNAELATPSAATQREKESVK